MVAREERQKRAVLSENLDAVVLAVGHHDPPVVANPNAVDGHELARRNPTSPKLSL